jgi:putative cell wall-binding protein
MRPSYVGWMRWFHGVLLTALVAALLGTTPARAADGQADMKRIAGADRYETAAKLALDKLPSASDAVVARADDPADALAGNYVAGTHIGPVLLADQHGVPQVTIDALKALHVHKVRVLGGTGALGPEVDSQLQAQGFTVERIAGNDRYATAAKIAANSGTANVGVRGDKGPTVILASGERPADALTSGPLAYGQQYPILLSTAATLPGVTARALDDLGVRHVVIVGGTAAVSQDVENAIIAGGRTTERVAGPDREGTAVAMADLLASLETVVRVEVASSTANADALALGGHAAPDAPILLCHAVEDCGTTTLTWITARSDAIDSVVIAGGTAVVGPIAETQLKAAAS